MCVCVRFTDSPGVTTAGVAGLLDGLTDVRRVDLRPVLDGALTGSRLSARSLGQLASNNARSLNTVVLPAGVSEEQLEALLEPLKALEHLTVSAPSGGGSRWLRALPKTLLCLDVTGEMLPHWEHVMSVTSVQSGSRGVRCAHCNCVPITDGDTAQAWPQQTIRRWHDTASY